MLAPIQCACAVRISLSGEPMRFFGVIVGAVPVTTCSHFYSMQGGLVIAASQGLTAGMFFEITTEGGSFVEEEIIVNVGRPTNAPKSVHASALAQ